MALPPTPDRHIEPDLAFVYFEAQLTEEEESAIEEHLARCADCARLSREVHVFHDAWEGWTAERHAAAELRSRMDAVLAAAEAGQSTDIADRLRRWRNRFGGAAEAGLQVAFDLTAGAASAAARGLDALTRAGGEWRFQPVIEPMAVRGTVAAKSSSVVLETGGSQHTGRARIAARAGSSGEITVRVERGGSFRGARLVVVAAADPRSDLIRIALAEARPGDDFAIVRFAGLPEGEYIVVIEPGDS